MEKLLIDAPAPVVLMVAVALALCFLVAWRTRRFG
jgi:hypothetical protein